MRESGPQSRARFQFSLQTLFALVAAAAVAMSMWRTLGEIGLYYFFLGAGVCLVGVGIYLRRIGLIVCGLVVVIGIETGIQFSARQTAVTSRTGLTAVALPVEVVDAATAQPIAGAKVGLLSGDPDPAATGDDGRAKLSCKLPLIVNEYDTMFGTMGESWISLGGVFVVVEADGYRPAAVFLENCLGEQWTTDKPFPPLKVEMERQD